MKKSFIKFAALFVAGLGLNFVSEIEATAYYEYGLETLVSGLSNLDGVACSSALGRVYFVERAGNIKWMPVRGGAVTTVESGLDTSSAICTDSSNNLYFTEVGSSHTIKRILASDSSISTLASGSSQGICADTSGNIFYSDVPVGSIYKIPSGGTASLFSSGFSIPQEVCADSLGNVYVASWSGTISKIPSSGGPGTVIVSGLSNPYGICVDASDNVYFSEFSGGSIKRILASDSSVTTIADGLSNPTGLSVDTTSGDIYFATWTGAISRLIAPITPTLTVEFTTGAEFSGDVTGGIIFTGHDVDAICTFNGSATDDVQVTQGKVSMSSADPIVSGKFMRLNGGGMIFTAGGALPSLAMDQDSTLEIHTTDNVELGHLTGSGELSIDSDRADVITVTTDLSADTAGGINMNHGKLYVNGGKTPNAPLHIANGVQLQLAGDHTSSSGQVSGSLDVDAGGAIFVDAGVKVSSTLAGIAPYSFMLVDGYFETGSDQIAWPSNLQSYVPYGETDGNPNWLTSDTFDHGVSYGGVPLNYSPTHFQSGGTVAGAVYWTYKDSLTGAHPEAMASNVNDVALVGDVTMQSGSSINLGVGSTWARDLTVIS